MGKSSGPKEKLEWAEAKEGEKEKVRAGLTVGPMRGRQQGQAGLRLLAEKEEEERVRLSFFLNHFSKAFSNSLQKHLNSFWIFDQNHTVQ